MMIGATSTRVSAEIGRQQALARDIARGQSDISSQKRLQVASDDPLAAARIADIRRTQADEAAWTRNVDAGAAIAARADATLATTATSVDRARELLILARTATTSAGDRKAIAVELASIADAVAAQSTAKDPSGRALFPTVAPLELPIGRGVALAATVSRGAAFGDLEATLRAAATAAQANDTAAIGTALDAIGTHGETLAAARAEQGVRAARFDAASEAFATSATDLADERGALEGTDLAAAVADVQSKLLTLSAAQAVFAKLNARTLFDLL